MISIGAIERLQPLRHGTLLPDRMLAGIILAELKQAAMGYTEAALAAASAEVRRVFEWLAFDTARKHEQLRVIMQQNGLLEQGFAAPAQEVRRTAERCRAALRGLQRPMASPPPIPSFRPYMDGWRPPQSAPGLPEFALPHMPPSAVFAAPPAPQQPVEKPPEAKEEAPPKRGRRPKAVEEEADKSEVVSK